MFTPECFSIAALIIMRAQRDAASHTSRSVILGLQISRPWRGSDAASDPAFRGHRRGSWLDRNLDPYMESPISRLLRLLVERDPARPEFISEFREALRPILRRAEFPGDGGFDLWQDVFVQQKLPWGRFLQSALLHTAAVALLWTISLSWIRQQKILDRAAFDRSSLVTYTPEEYLPPLDTGVPEAPKPQKGDPAYARQPILSVPREADNRSQTIVVPPDLKLDRDVALPNIVAMGAIVPA